VKRIASGIPSSISAVVRPGFDRSRSATFSLRRSSSLNLCSKPTRWRVVSSASMLRMPGMMEFFPISRIRSPPRSTSAFRAELNLRRPPSQCQEPSSSTVGLDRSGCGNLLRCSSRAASKVGNASSHAAWYTASTSARYLRLKAVRSASESAQSSCSTVADASPSAVGTSPSAVGESCATSGASSSYRRSIPTGHHREYRINHDM